MTRTRKHDWPALLAEFEQSGLTQVEFCRQRGLSPRYFSMQRSKHLGHKRDAFAPVKVAPPAASAFHLQVGRCQVVCPAGMPLETLARLVHALA